MSLSISGSTAISGLSGMDTNFDTVLEQLYTVEKTQLNQLQAWKSDWQLRYDAFNSVIDQMSAAKQMLSNIGSVNHFVTKNAISTDEKVLTAVAAGSAANGQHKIDVQQMASNAIWCNTGAVFENKTDIINDTGSNVTFKFDYAGKSYEYEVPPNTTLESFVSMINNSSKNPGVNVSVVNTGRGYVMQIAGKSTGEENSLTIYSCGLKGMNASGSTSVWKSDYALDPNAAITNPTNYVYKVTLDSGTKVSVNIKGDATNAELAEAIKHSVGAGLITDGITNNDGSTSAVDSSGNIVLKGVRSIERTVKGEEAYTPAGYKLEVSNLNESLVSGADGSSDLTVTIQMKDGSNTVSREFTIANNATRRDLVDQIKQSIGSSANLGLQANGGYSISLANVESISVDDGNGGVDLSTLGFTGTAYDASPSDATDSLVSTIQSATTKLTFDTNKLSTRLDGKASDAEANNEKMVYTLVKTNGEAIYVNGLTGSSTYQDLVNAINQAYTTTSETNGDNQTLTLDHIKSFYLSTGSNGTSGFTTDYDTSTQIASSNFVSNPSDPNDPTKFLLETPPNLNYTIVLNNEANPVTVTATTGSTLKDIVTQLNTAVQAADSTASVSWVDSDGNTVDDVDNYSGDLYLQITNVQSASGAGIAGQIVKSSNWDITNASNAIYRVDNWPMYMESASNTITDLLDNVSITLQGAGQANLTISTDVTSVETSIQNFLDAVNSVLYTIREYTEVDESKERTSNDPNDIGNENYSKSTLTSEIGGLLTGNYGVQLVKSRFMSVVTGTPPGFQTMATADDLLSGDILSCLSNMGIKTDTDATSETYGLLVIAPRSDFLQSMDNDNYQDMLNNHVNDLVDFFVSEGTGTSTSADFRYNSHIKGITEAGVYDVEYTVDQYGQISNVTVGGAACTREESRGGYYYTCTSGPARGLSLSIDDLTYDPETQGVHKGQIRIKQGLVQTVESFLNKELTFHDVNISANAPAEILQAQISMKSENGAIMTLKSNYATIMENIDKSISNEQRRLDTWYNRQKNVFANLETLLRELNSQQESLESQLSQLGG
ncbi:MAG: flagellar filament capping protein FliD [Desulfovibrionaceae bacterium]|nr:flagellar filament capping protein FliD [Desulfovibrionaceae bacterium]